MGVLLDSNNNLYVTDKHAVTKVTVDQLVAGGTGEVIAGSKGKRF